jgi:hypothetical protein
VRAWILVFILVFVGCSSSSNGGNEGPGGGDVTAQQAGELAAEIYSAVRAAPRSYPEVNLADLQAAIRERTFANGVETDATNDGVDLIELNRQRWRLITERDRKRALLFHEILGLMGLEKNNYYISSRMLSAKNRFTDKAEYRCSFQGRTCRISMKYDRTIKGFLVEELDDCGGFPSSPITIYRRLTDAIYSSNGYCPENEDDNSGGGGSTSKVSCSIHSGDGLHWDSLNFLDGYEFFFGGRRDGNAMANGQMHCVP